MREVPLARCCVASSLIAVVTVSPGNRGGHGGLAAKARRRRANLVDRARRFRVGKPSLGHVVREPVQSRELFEIHATRFHADEKRVLLIVRVECREDRRRRREELPADSEPGGDGGQCVFDVGRGITVAVQRAREFFDEIEGRAVFAPIERGFRQRRTRLGQRAFIRSWMGAPEGGGKASKHMRYAVLESVFACW